MSTTLDQESYRWIDRDGYSRRGLVGETQWLPVGRTVSPIGVGSQPCGPGVLHAYISPEVAVLADPVHGQYLNTPGAQLIAITGASFETDGLKRWTTRPVDVRRIVPIPALTLEERVAWAIVLAPHALTRAWAVRWLSGEDRTVAAAWAAARAAQAAARAQAAWAAARAAARAARGAAADAAWEAARAAREAAAWAAADAAWAAEAWAARAAAGAAEAWAGEAEGHLMPALLRARAILAKTYPAEQYDAPLIVEEEIAR